MKTPPYLIAAEGEALIALGGNLGEPALTIASAIEKLGAREDTRVLATSALYDTAPVGPPQPRYLNAVARISTTLGPHTLLEVLLEVERELGRVRVPGERWGPRIIDLDLLAHGGNHVDDETLTLPHPRANERLFVLEPLADLIPGSSEAGRALRERLRALRA